MTDPDLRQAVLDELDFEPGLDAGAIVVAIEEGCVILAGEVRAHAEKRKAECIVRRVRSVRAVRSGIEVRCREDDSVTDPEIARRAAELLSWAASVPREGIEVVVDQGHLTLSGHVSWQYQKCAAEGAVQDLAGVTGVENLIEVSPVVSPADLRQRIEKALSREAEREARGIEVRVSGARVTLEGRVRSWTHHAAARRAAWATPGVADVVDHITVGS